MYRIAIIVPMKNIFDFKTDFYNYSEYNFIIIKQNVFAKYVLNKYKINNVICSENCYINYPDFNVCDGCRFFMDNLTYFVSKQFKKHNLNHNSSSIAIVFYKYSEKINTFVIQISKLFKNIIFVTENVENCEIIAEQIMENYGIFIQVKNINTIIECDMAVETSSTSAIYKNKPIIINIDSNILIPKEYNIPVPYKVKKIALAEALYVAKQNIDNLL